MRSGHWFRSFRTGHSGAAGTVLVMLALAVAFVGPHVAPHAPDQQFREGLGEFGVPRAPDGVFLLGSDALGRDELSRILHGGQISLSVALLATAIAVLLGLSVGIVAGYFEGLADGVAMRVTDTFLSLPFLLVAIAVHRVIAVPGFAALAVLLACFSWPALARVTRAKVLQSKQLAYVEAARALGAGDLRILLRHVLPNVIGPAIVLGSGMIADMIIVESAMSFLGLGVQPPEASWGSMLYESRELMPYAPHLVIAPGLMIVLVVFGFNLLGEGLRNALDPRT